MRGIPCSLARALLLIGEIGLPELRRTGREYPPSLCILQEAGRKIGTLPLSASSFKKEKLGGVQGGIFGTRRSAEGKNAIGTRRRRVRTKGQKKFTRQFWAAQWRPQDNF